MKTVILSTNDNLNYLSYLPYVQKAWNCLGWNTLTFYLGKQELKSSNENKIIKINEINSYREATVVQISRLFACKYIDGLIMTSDIDMMPLSDYWKPDENEITCYGSDLTYFKHHPICYIAANQKKWNELIYEESIEELLIKYPQAKSNIFDEWWFLDQQLITERIEKDKQRKIIKRGFYNNLPCGRIDRSDWENSKNFNFKKIDAHMPRPFDEKEAKDLLHKFHGATL